MNLLKNKIRSQRGQGLMEYTLIVFLVTIGFWGAMKGTDIGPELVATWSKVVNCVSAPFACVS
jgi:Flp pilus assembly pilin Flp